MKKYLLIAGLMLCTKIGYCASGLTPVTIQPVVSVSSVGIAGAPAAVTIAAPLALSANSSGSYNYITNIHIEYYAAATLTGGATPVTCTTTNLQSLALKFPSAEATGVEAITDLRYDTHALQGTLASAVTISCPATASVIWNVVATYFVSN